MITHRRVTLSTVTAIYDRYRYDKEKRAALEKVAEVLSGVVEVSRRRRQLRPEGHCVRTRTSSSREPSDVPKSGTGGDWLRAYAVCVAIHAGRTWGPN